MITSKAKLAVLLSIFVLLVGGHFFARWAGQFEHAWLYVIAFYWGWIALSLAFFLTREDWKSFYSKGHRWYWNALTVLLIIPAVLTVLLPNLALLQPNAMLGLHLTLCLLNPWLEETYWRGLISKTFTSNRYVSFLVSCVAFAISHPFVLGVNSPSLQGFAVLAGTFVTGAVWWIVFQKTKTLRGNVVTHFLVNIAGMTAYVLANVAVTQ